MARRNRREDGCCSVTFVKWVLFVYNFVLLIVGGLVLGVSIWTLLDRHQYVSLLTSITYPTLVYLLLVAGALVIIISLLGFFAVAKERRALLVIYIYVLLLIFITEATVGVISYVYREQIHNVLEMTLNDNFANYYGIDNTVTESVDFLQEEFNCCGVIKYEDWNMSIWHQDGFSNLNLVPDSCCISNTPDCGRRTHPSNIYYEGCLDRVEEHLKMHLNILCVIGLGICVIQIFGIIYAFVLYHKLHRVVEITRKRKQKNPETENLFI